MKSLTVTQAAKILGLSTRQAVYNRYAGKPLPDTTLIVRNEIERLRKKADSMEIRLNAALAAIKLLHGHDITAVQPDNN